MDWNVCKFVSFHFLPVVPHAGTWIEIAFRTLKIICLLSFPTRERGLKSCKDKYNNQLSRRSPRGNVDWNYLLCFQAPPLFRRSPRGNVDWNIYMLICFFGGWSRSPRGNVDWNIFKCFCQARISVVPHAGTWIEILTRHPVEYSISVVPHAGTWIEMYHYFSQ